MDIALAVTEAASHKRALFAWAINDVRHMHKIFWDHLAPFVYRIRPPPIKQTEILDSIEDVDMVSEKDFVNIELLDRKYGNVDSWVKERLKSLEVYQKEVEV